MAVKTVGEAPENARFVNPNLFGFGDIGASVINPDQGYTKWRTPTSNNSGEMFYRKRDDTKGVDYLYDRIETISPVMKRSGFPGVPPQQEYADSMFGGLGGIPQSQRTPLYTRSVTFKKRGLAPGQSPEGARQPEQARQRSGAGDQSGGGSNYATNRNKAGRKGTILTGPRGTLGQSSNAGGKTLLGA